MIYNTPDKSIPPVRRNISIFPISDNGRDIVYFHDPLGYIDNGFALDAKVQPILSMITGQTSVSQISKLFEGQLADDELLQFIQFLDENLILQSSHFRTKSNEIERSFEELPYREPALTPQSYPDEPEKLSRFLKDYLSGSTENQHTPKKGLYAPHIDLKVGRENYRQAFSYLKDLRPEKVVILATAHYPGYYPDLYEQAPFILSDKEFRIPGRSFKTDSESVSLLSKNANKNGITLSDRAHRIEHSIETHLLLASHYWNHDFTIVPILIGGFDELLYMKDGDLGNKLDHLTNDLKKIDDDDTFFLISGDLSHVGKKFGDALPASELRPDVESFDKRFVKNSLDNNRDELVALISEEYDPYRVCGFPPLLTFLNTFPDLKGKLVKYDWWDEPETESAVSYSSIAF